ncbi:MAG TPA: GIY-YIG nuclease family protein [Flavisolibacter sp.]|jgi:putative endonuclease|nr:GIY-YIG nuclease family protein [Flavisolibacter sp.]
MIRGGTVYIMTNPFHTVLYVGVTSDLLSRVLQHKQGYYDKSFSKKYKLDQLVYYRFFGTIEEAIAEEKRIKGGSRFKKIQLINSINPKWIDLWKSDLSKW